MKPQTCISQRLGRLALIGLMIEASSLIAFPQEKPADEPSLERLKELVRGTTQRRAFKSQDMDQAAALLKANPELVKSRDTGGGTLLHWAAVTGDRGKAALLLAHGADIHDKDNAGGVTPLHERP